MIGFAFPWAFAALPLPLLVYWLMPVHRQRVPALRFPFFRQIAATAQSPAGHGSVVLTRTWFQMSVAVAVWCLLVVALAQPERIGFPEEVKRSARDVVLAIDISGSMDTRDFKTPDGGLEQRLAGVREVVDGFIAGREGDRVALIVFGSKAYVQSPLTDDLETVAQLLDRTEVGMAGPHTALGDAIGLAIRTFEASDIEQRLLILLSDGSDTASRMSPVNAAGIAARRGIEIFTIGVGDPEASGEGKIDLAALKTIARRTGGAYFYAEDQAGLADVYARIDDLAPREFMTLSYRPKTSLAYLPLGIAALLSLSALLGSGIAAERRKRGR